MISSQGISRPELQQLPQMRERISFLYLERCKINRADGAITVTDQRGTIHIPAAVISTLFLGPGSNITHRAVELLGDAGANIIWVGEQGVRYYAHGRPLTSSARLLMAQADAVSNTRSKLAVARRMYQMRFPEEDVSKMTMQQLRGREGARIRSVYRKASRETGVDWHGREYDPDNFLEGTPVNMALSAAHACLYGLVHSVIVALGCSPGLGFIHVGHEKSFVYDIADLYKSEFTIPLAFKIAAQNPDDIGSVVRRSIRDVFSNGHLLERIVRDIRNLLLQTNDIQQDEDVSIEVLNLWDEKMGLVASGVSYRDSTEDIDFDDSLEFEGSKPGEPEP